MPKARLRRPGHARNGGRKPIIASNAAPPPREQIIAGIAPAIAGRVRLRTRAVLRCHDGTARDVDLRVVRTPRQLLDGAAIEIARREIHVRKSAAGGKHVVDEADSLEQLRPIDVGDQAHAGDDVAHGDARGTLPLVCVAYDSVRCQSLRCQTLVEPGQRRSNSGILIAQPVHELHREGVRQRCPVVVRKHHRRRFGGASAGAQQTVGDSVRLLPGGAIAHDRLGETSQILDEHDPQCDRNCPELADHQRLDLLVGPHVAAQHLGIEAAVGVSDERPCHAKHPRISGEWPVGELGQLPIIAGRQIGTDVVDLPLDEIVVVEQPLRCRGDGAILVRRLGDGAMRIEEHCRVFGEPTRQRMAPDRLWCHRLSCRQAPRVLLDAFDAEELLANGVPAIPR